jgi:uncharacterized protein
VVDRGIAREAAGRASRGCRRPAEEISIYLPSAPDSMMMSLLSRSRRVALILSITSIGVVGCDRAESPPHLPEVTVTFDEAIARIETDTDTLTLRVEVAETDQQRRVGLMRREHLDADAGMIFLFQEQQPPDGAFYMFNTLIPLSIAFLDADGRIGSIRQMEPCPSPYPQWCPNYEARVPFVAALEVNAGYFAERGITVGDRVVLQRE